MSRTNILEEVQGASEKRLYPPLTDPNWLVLRKRRDLFRNWINNKIGTVPLVLDVGGRLQPCRVLFPEQTHYLSVDRLGSPLVIFIASHNDQFAVNYSVLARKGLCTSESLNRLVPAV